MLGYTYILSQTFSHMYTPTFLKQSFYIYPPMKMKQTAFRNVGI